MTRTKKKSVIPKIIPEIAPEDTLKNIQGARHENDVDLVHDNAHQMPHSVSLFTKPNLKITTKRKR